MSSSALVPIKSTDLRVANTVCRARIGINGAPVRNLYIAYKFPGMAKNAQFRSSMSHISDDQGRTSMVFTFNTGSIVICGTHTEEDALLRAYQICFELQKDFKFRANPIQLGTHNIVGSANVATSKDYEIDMDLFRCDNPQHVIDKNFCGMHYAPDAVPGVPADRNLTYVLFRGGTVIVTGVRELEHLGAGYRFIRQKLSGMQKGKTYRQLTQKEALSVASRKRAKERYAAGRKRTSQAAKRKRVYNKPAKKRRKKRRVVLIRPVD